MTQFNPNDDQGTKDLVSKRDVILEADSDQDGVGDLIFRTGGVERARIDHAGTGTGWANVLGGSLSFVTASPYNAKCDGRRLTGNMTSGSPTFTATSGTFTAADVGKVVAVGDNSGSGVVMAFTATVSAFVSSTQVTLSANAPHTLTAVSLDIATDDTAAIQAAIDATYAAGGGKVVCPDADILVSSLTLKQGVTLTTLTGNQGYAAQRTGGARLRSVTTGAVIVDTPSATTYAPGIIGFQLDGHGVASVGVRIQNPQWGVSKALSFTNFTDQALLVSGGNAHTIEDVVAVNCVLTRTRAAVTGVVEIRGADHHVHRIEANSSLTGLTDANMYVQGVLIAQTNGFHSHVIGEISDGGIYVSGNYNRFSSCRADLCYGHGWTITGNNNAFSACHGVACGAAAANTYDHFKITGQQNAFSACRSRHASGNTVKYGFEDTTVLSTVSLRNTYDLSCGGDAATAAFISATYSGSGRKMPPFDAHPANSTTQLDATGTSMIVLDLYSTPTNVTDILGGVSGQDVAIYGNANVTIKHNAGSAGSTIKTNTQADKTLAAGKFYRFTFFNGTWYEDAGITFAGNPLLATANWQSGRYYYLPNTGGQATSNTLGNGNCRAVPFYVPNGVTLIRLGGEVTVIGDVGSKLRLGIYADDGTGRPGALVLDAGTIAADSATVQELTISQALAQGTYWAVAAVQLVTTTQPTVRTHIAGPVLVDGGTTTPAAGANPFARLMTGITGALPGTWTDAGVTSAAPRLFGKVN